MKELKSLLKKDEFACLTGSLWALRKKSADLKPEEKETLDLLFACSPELRQASRLREPLTRLFDQEQTKESGRHALRRRMTAVKRIHTSANWFFWIAGLSMINTVIAISGGNWSFIAGLGFTQLVDAVMQNAGSIGTVIALAFDILAAAVFVGLGLLARRMVVWPFIVGLIIYVLDALILIIAQLWLGVAFHVYVLIMIVVGMNTLRKALRDGVNFGTE